ncbi:MULTISPECIES: hypothetical protein [Bacteroidota]|jgi:hypothetical protein|uniref:YubB ferredoxin-like domain-containing protein n=3 Tax=Bacteroidota TaxID=976 RepID=A0A1N7Q9P8_9FLAO|nr:MULTISPECIES: hypothetical protein [Bacteroidota]MDV3710620.1 hypothetical protein [Elizabethkingia anophelis]KQB98918.1 hypothetical protein AQF98_19505 [Pedobacter sp. Hv1]MDV3765747.1 hypothetical protein [Elizabethkingia anophelis]RDC55235.1 hypothetical protein DU508_16790 [Pedobacter chinensis]SIT19583.1 hypothetical protein SAMN05421786_108123 [Chryseobacterium ureilyticum]
MANWCSNTVVFEGKPEAITAIQELFQSMKEKEEKTEEGQLPEFMEDTNGGYFFNIYWNEGDEGQFQYETKWSPNIEIIQKISEYYQVDFVQDYEEMGNLVYGRATYRDGILSDIFLGGDDFETYEQDEETDLYHFEGEEYESDYEILETLLERKITTL